MKEGADAPKGGPEAASPALRPSQAPRASRASPPPRGSQPPDPWKGWWRVAFGVTWVAVQAALILTAGRRPDGAFGFRMFAESSTIKVALYRELIGDGGERKLVHVDSGVWSARDAGGLVRRFAWTDRVRRRELSFFDTEVSAHYGANAVLTRLHAALDDLATHTPDDAETRRFLLDVTVRRNAREPYVVRLASAERAGGP